DASEQRNAEPFTVRQLNVHLLEFGYPRLVHSRETRQRPRPPTTGPHVAALSIPRMTPIRGSATPVERSSRSANVRERRSSSPHRARAPNEATKSSRAMFGAVVRPCIQSTQAPADNPRSVATKARLETGYHSARSSEPHTWTSASPTWLRTTGDRKGTSIESPKAKGSRRRPAAARSCSEGPTPPVASVPPRPYEKNQGDSAGVAICTMRGGAGTSASWGGPSASSE